MSLTFASGGTDHVAVNDVVGIRDLTAFTAIAWLNETTQANNNRIWGKGLDAAGHNRDLRQTNLAPSTFFGIVRRATTQCDATTSTTFSTGHWYCIAETYDETDGIRIFWGDLSNTMVESAYTSRNVGSGATSTGDSDSALMIGARGAGNVSFGGQIGFFGLWNVRLALADLKELQYRPIATSGCQVLSWLGYNGTGTQPDWSGHGNSGAVTTATLSAPPPLIAPFGSWNEINYIVLSQSSSATLTATTASEAADGVAARATLSATATIIIGGKANLSAIASLQTLSFAAALSASATLTTRAGFICALLTTATLSGSSGQRIFPVSDTTIGIWTTDQGATTNLWQAINSEVDAWTAAVNFANIDPNGVSSNPADSGGNNYGFNTIIIDPYVPSTIYIGTNYQGLWYSTDYGMSWSLRSTGTNGPQFLSSKLWTLAIDNYTGYIYTSAAGNVDVNFGQGIMKSTDAGISWTQMLPANGAFATSLGTNDVYSIATDPYVANHIIATFHSAWSGGTGTGVIESANGGTTWVRRNPPFIWGAGSSVAFGGDTNTWIVGIQIAAGGNTDGYWVTRNAGTTWNKVSNKVLAHGATQSVYRDPTLGTLIAAADTTVLRSTDGGTTWTDIGTSGLSGFILNVACDGTTMYTAPSSPTTGDNGSSHTPMFKKLLTASDASAWTNFGVTNDRLDPSGYFNGPVASAYDATNRILYTVNWAGGVWKFAQTRDAVQSPLRAISNSYTTHMGAMASPGFGIRTLAFEYRKTAPSGQVDLTVDLLQGSTIVQTWAFNNVSDILTMTQQPITATISDWSIPFDIRFTANQSV